jgi:peptidoglycan/xylan/chitin deacetylase (PgdA/CDA1 family)
MRCLIVGPKRACPCRSTVASKVVTPRANRAARLLILGWHNVEGTWSFPAAPGAGRRGIARQLRTLSRWATVVPLGWALEQLESGARLPPRSVAITFDDGYADNLILAVPLLERLGLPATFFLVPGFLSNAARPWWEDLACAVNTATRRLVDWEGTRYILSDARSRSSAYASLTRRLQFRSSAAREAAVTELIDRLRPSQSLPDLMMGWDGAREVARRGFDVQSHTMAHAVLGEETAEAQQRDLRMARGELERELGIEVTTIAYPHGTLKHYNSDTIAAAGVAGYRWGLTTREGLSTPATPRMELRRCVMYPERGVRDLFAQARYLIGSE